MTISIPSHPFNHKNSEIRARKTISGFKIKSSETKGVSIYLPDVKNSEKLEVDFEGNFVVNKIIKVPFQIGGALRALIAAP